MVEKKSGNLSLMPKIKLRASMGIKISVEIDSNIHKKRMYYVAQIIA